jgi:hypothetical protein
LPIGATVITAYDRALFEATYRAVLPALEALARRVPRRVLRALANRADRREAAAYYTDEAVRVGALRRIAVDRFDARSDAVSIYYRELRRRGEGS